MIFQPSVCCDVCERSNRRSRRCNDSGVGGWFESSDMTPRRVGARSVSWERLTRNAQRRRVPGRRWKTAPVGMTRILRPSWNRCGCPPKREELRLRPTNSTDGRSVGTSFLLIGAVRLRDLTPEVVDDWVRDLIRISETGKRRLGATSSRLVRKVLSMALEEAVQRGRNPVALTQPPPVSRTHERLAWTLEEARAFLAGLGGHRLAAAFQLCLVTGLRRGEVLALRWDVVDLERRQLEVVQQLAVERGRPVLSNSRPRRARGS